MAITRMLSIFYDDRHVKQPIATLYMSKCSLCAVCLVSVLSRGYLQAICIGHNYLFITRAKENFILLLKWTFGSFILLLLLKLSRTYSKEWNSEKKTNKFILKSQ